MISSKSELLEYLQADLDRQPASTNFFKRVFADEVVKMKKHLRYCEYYHNSHTLMGKLLYLYHKYLLRKYLMLFGSEIPENVFGKGLTIWHPQCILVNGSATVGDYCSISRGVVIAQAHDKSPSIGDHVELMVDSKVLGGISVANHVRIGASALVIKPIETPDTTWGGVPAKLINNTGTIETPIPRKTNNMS